MKRYIVYIVCALFMLASSGTAFAVEKKEKKKIEKKEQVQEKKVTKKAVKPKKTTEKNYDNFIVKNNNGIDERKENLKNKTTSKKD